MADNKNFDSFAGIHFKNLAETGPNNNCNPWLVRELGKLGVGTLLVPDSKAYNFEEKTVLAHFATTKGEDELLVEKIDETPMDTGGLEIVRARMLTPAKLSEIMPVINGPELRSLGASKWEQYLLAKEFMPKTILLNPEEELDRSSINDTFHTNKLVIKADMSMASKFMKVATKNEVAIAVNGMREEFALIEKERGKNRSNNKIIIQEFVPGLAWNDLEGVDPKSKDLLAGASDTELRVFCYVDRDKKIAPMHRYYATARVFDNNHKDDWASVNQDSVPLRAWQIADIISDRFLAKADVAIGYLAVDLFMGDAKDGLGRRIFVREVNTRDPLMVSKDDNQHDAFIQRQLLANAMATGAKNYPRTGNI
jgi:hypothetical protein